MGGRGRETRTETERERRQKLRSDLNDDISGTGSRIDLEQKAFETADSRASYGLVICDGRGFAPAKYEASNYGTILIRSRSLLSAFHANVS